MQYPEGVCGEEKVVTAPRVSVIMPSFNHEKYVARAIRGVLDQTWQDFELVITDDGSSDATVEEIRKFEDPRIRLFTFAENTGGALATMKCVSESRGEYLAMLSSDDVFLPDKLEKQVSFLNVHPDVSAVFSFARIIDADGNDIPDHWYGDVFQRRNRTRFQWLNRFFYRGNCLCHPSVLARREVYTSIGPSDPRFVQLGDFYRWVRLCMKSEIFIIPEELVMFRVIGDEYNLSGERPETAKRGYFELCRILDKYLEIQGADEFLRVFPEASGRWDRIEDDLIPYYLAMLALEVKSFYPAHQGFALKVLFDLLADSALAERLKDVFGFGYADFVRLTGEHDVFNIPEARRLAERDNRIQAFMDSWSWKVTSPLRKAHSLLKKKGADG
jgi:glycosyltransferase involved in cell wall biosynthesis